MGNCLLYKLKEFVFNALLCTPLAACLMERRVGLLLAPMNEKYELNRRLREERTPAVLERMRKRVAVGEPLRVAFFVFDPQMFALRPLFDLMCADPAFEPRIVLTPETSVESDKQVDPREMYELLCTQYKERVMPIAGPGYDLARGICPDISGDTDVCVYSRPYDDMVHEYFRMDYLSKKCLCLYTNYSYGGTSHFLAWTLRFPNRAFLWRVFTHNEQEGEMIHDTNIFLSGSCVNDSFAKVEKKSRERKRVILAPHHSLPGNSTAILQLATFLDNWDVYLELPKRYPQVDFVFRPHPHLISKLKNKDMWGEARTEAWLKEFLDNRNVVYDTRGNYAEIMADSDALIHDCASFMADYFYTGNPQCYLMRRHVHYGSMLTPFGMQVLSHTYQARTKQRIFQFMDEVVLQGKDPMKAAREDFANRKIKIGYPDVATSILRHLKQEFGIAQ